MSRFLEQLIVKIATFYTIMLFIIICTELNSGPTKIQQSEPIKAERPIRQCTSQKPIGFSSNQQDRVLFRLPSFEKIRFAHSALRLHHFGNEDCNRFKQWGLVTDKDISFGTILVVEHPMLIWTEAHRRAYEKFSSIKQRMQLIHYLVEEQKQKDPEFEQFWNRLEAPEQDDGQDSYFQRHGVNGQDGDPMGSSIYGAPRGRRPSAVYPILSKINFGVPQNVMVISGDTVHNDVSILMATKDIVAGEELVMDFTVDWATSTSISHALAVKQGLKVKLNDHETWPLKEGKQRKLTDTEYAKMMLALYSYGLVGRQPGLLLETLPHCRFLTVHQCERKNEILALVDSGDIWKLVSGEMEPPSWTGEIRDQSFWFVG